jgi:DNA-binding GntR family transcriptional regulator
MGVDVGDVTISRRGMALAKGEVITESGERAADGAAATTLPSTAEELAEVLRLRIQRRELAPDEWLREAKLCSEFGVGRSLVRSALRTLAADGLVGLEENRGARVSSTTVEEVFDLYEIRAALYGMAARVACLRASDAAVAELLAKIDQMLSLASKGAPAEEIIEISEAIFSMMAEAAGPDARKMIEGVRRKTRWHYSYVALAINATSPGPYEHWRQVRAALLARDADKASQSARDILYFMQSEVARIMIARGPRLRDDILMPSPASRPVSRAPAKTRAVANRR